ncbi:hypothetical protein Arub01_17630 [Actinomadura rubrobrunea]|uniref:Uncharacterized protein n=1 Tax=Actinomadura rubrobrunea TaxID=115335 RepID=A0A9W6PUW7_9ACTN|nr:hypothetical protein Arub01_17630 [Actinomadura rubrobrunea]
MRVDVTPSPPRNLVEFPLSPDASITPGTVDTWRDWFRARDKFAAAYGYEFPDEDDADVIRVCMSLVTTGDGYSWFPNYAPAIKRLRM